MTTREGKAAGTVNSGQPDLGGNLADSASDSVSRALAVKPLVNVAARSTGPGPVPVVSIVC